MRKLILVALAATSLMAAPTAHADEGANIALGVLGGIILGGAFSGGGGHNNYYAPPPPVYYAPPPPVYYVPPQPRYYQPYCQRINYYDYYGNYTGTETICR